LFENPGAAEAFLVTLFQAAEKYGWQVHAYVLMRNHFHLAVETPEPTLGEGMHWLQSSMATRFNRLHAESGHLFQGRYQALMAGPTVATRGGRPRCEDTYTKRKVTKTNKTRPDRFRLLPLGSMPPPSKKR